VAEHRPDISPYDWLVWADGELEQALASGARRRDVLAYLGEPEYATLAPLARAAAAATRDPDRCVHLIPGIMGSQLGLRRGAGEPPDLLWVDPVDLQCGRLDELAIGNDRVVSLGAAPYSYLALKLRLEAAGFTVRWADYDWRRGVDAIGAALAARILAEPARRHSLVGHSLGGLVARAALATAGERIDRIVTLGTPHGGSYAALQALRGSYVSVRRVVQLDPGRSAEALTESVFAHFPSLYHMLPCAGDGPDLRDAAQWPDSTPRPHAPLLAEIGRLSLPAPVDTLRCIVGTGFETVTQVTREAQQFRYHITRDGDGTVPRAFATLAGHDAWFTTTLHGELSRDATVAAATIDLLHDGRTTILPRTPPPLPPGARSITDEVLRQACADKLDWAAMSPADRHAWFELLNAPVAAGSVVNPAP
jgi:pimeloyl-ACP methyl ester carboxylesterase